MDYYTMNTGNRPDLAALPINQPEGFIGTRIYPVAFVAEKGGSASCATVTADSAAQTGRSAGAAPTATQIANTAKSFTCAEWIKRGGITPDEAKQMGGIEKADEVGAKWAMRQVLNLRETTIAAALLTAASKTWDPGKCRTDLQTAINALRLYPGKIGLVAGTYTLKAMVQNIAAEATVGAAFARIVTGTNSAQAVLGLNFEAWKNGLAMFLGVDEVLAGDDAVWAASGSTSGKFAVCKLDNSGDPIAHKYLPVLGRTFTFLPDAGGTEWTVEAIADRVNKSNWYDATIWGNVVDINTGAKYVFDGVAP